MIVHVFEKETREHYGIERLWMDAETVRFESDEDTADLGRQDERALRS